MKICIFTETYYPVVGGGETQAQILAERLSAQGHSVILITRRSDRSLKRQERIGPVTVYRLPPVGTGQMKKWGLLFSSLPVLLKLNKQYDLIFVSGFRIIGITAVLVSKLFRKYCILKADSQGEMSGGFFMNGMQKLGLTRSGLLFKLFLFARNGVLNRADAFCAISSDTAHEYLTSGVNAAKIHIIPNSADTARFYPVSSDQKNQLRAKLDIPQNVLSVVFTGRLVSYKGLPLLLKVWKKVAEKHMNVRLFIIGAGGLDMHNCEGELRDYVKANNLESIVFFTGNVQNVQEYLQASDIFAFPTENDAFPSALIEAMACGLPVVTTPVGSIKTFIVDGENGLLIPPGDFEPLYLAIERVLVDRELASRLGQSGLETVRNFYSAEVVTQKYITLFEKTVATHRQNPLSSQLS